MATLLTAPAKLNLFLNVTGLRADGFHHLNTVFFRLPNTATALNAALFADELTFTLTEHEGLQLACNVPQLNTNNNTVCAAYHQFYATLPQCHPVGVHVLLNKQLPHQAGLGGGSSNAASMLWWLYTHHNQPCSLAMLQAIGYACGSDVPFFLLHPPHTAPYAAIATGRGGDALTPVVVHPQNPILTQRWWVIKPQQGMGTATAYGVLRQANQYHTANPAALIAALATPQDPSPWFMNDFTTVAQTHIPAFASICQTMQAVGVAHPLLCGSGSSVAGLLPPNVHTLNLANKLPMNTANWVVYPTTHYT
jgi:4-diphosphocytidyl-2-C-methyl-D-erythritol kinase